jgi:hypothetical protein
LIAVIDKAMAKDMAQRFQLPFEFAEALDPWTQTPIPPPPPEEMPQLSLAAMGGSAPDSNPAITKGGPAEDESPSSRKVWQVPGTTPTPRSNPKPGPSPIATPPKGNLAALPKTAPSVAVQPKRPAAPATRQAATTNGRARQAAAAKPAVATADELDALAAAANTIENNAVTTPRVESKKKVATTKAMPAAPLLASLTGKPPLFWGIVAGAALAGALAASGLGWLAWHIASGAAPATTGATTLTHTVGGPNDLSIEHVLARARSNDRIVLQGDVVAGGVSVKWPNLTIESTPGHRYTWSCPKNADPKTPLLDVDAVQGLVVREINFDGGKKADTLIQLRGKCPGLTLQDLKLTNFNHCGVRVTNAEGVEGRPVQFTRLEVNPREAGQTGILFDLDSQGTKRPNRWFRVIDCKSGNGKVRASASPPEALEKFEPADLFKAPN